MLRRLQSILLACCSFIAIACDDVAAREAAESGIPNVVLFVADDLGWADVGSNGSSFHRTPHIDRLASDGMRFTRAYAACPVCSPTRAALMTGQYPARLRLTDWIPGNRQFASRRLLRPEFRQELPLEEVTIAEQLQAAGYVTAQIGKWHLGGEGYEPTRQGFDLGIAGDGLGSPRSYFAPYVGRDGRSIPGLEEAPAGEYLTDRLTSEAEQFIEANRNRPFFLYLPHFAVHTPLKAKEDKIAKYRAAPKPPGLQNNPIYAAMVESMDESLGRIVARLDALGLSENTLVVFTSDNGGLATLEGPNTPATNNAPLREGKGYLYEGGIRVPLIVKWPGHIKAGVTSDVPTSSIDIPPTIAAACHAPFEKRLEGVSLLPVLEQSGESPARDLYWHYPHYSNQGGKPGGAIVSGNYKLIEFYEDGRRELFDLSQNASESKNLIEREPQRAAQLARRLATWLHSVNADMPTPNPDYTPDGQDKQGHVLLPGKNARIHGVMLRYEPLPHKNTLGFWTRVNDWASWDFQIDRPGTFEIEILQGCGPGSGGSQVDFTVDERTITTTVEETRGFQDFVARRIGTIELARPGRYTLSVKPRSRPGAAVMDLRQVRLVLKSDAEK
jgi:arylsulfatase A-like enzyme